MNQASRVAVLTGACSDGIGTAILRDLVGRGWTVYGSYEPGDAASAAVLQDELPSAHLTETDHADRAALDAFISSIPADVRINALVNGQFYFAMEDPSDFDFEIWDRSLAVNLTAPNYLFHGFKSRFEAASVVTITSTEGFIGSFGASAYAATKAAVHNLTKTLANVSGAQGTRVNAVAAGWIGGVMDTDDVFNMSRAITPLARLGAPEEIAQVVAFLLSSESSFVNGSVITVDGGYTGVDPISKYEFEAEHSAT